MDRPRCGNNSTMEAVQTKSYNELAALLKQGRAGAMTYKDFMQLMQELSEQGKTTGSIQSESLVDYTKMNHRRMKRWDKTYKLSEKVKSQLADLDNDIEWLVLTESWCGDAAPSLPVINKMAEESTKLQLGILLRDENPELMEHFRTEGNLSIPKLIAIDRKNNEVLGEWGPRPSKVTEMAREFKNKYGSLTAEFKEDLQRWYNADKGKNIEEDLSAILALKYIGDGTDL